MKHQQWQITFINGYLTSLSNAARKRIVEEGKYPFISNLTTDEWNGFLNKTRIDYTEKVKWNKIKGKSEIQNT
jgi:hypothetical protein